MLLDKENVFSDGQAITATAYCTNPMDLGATATGPHGSVVKDLGKGLPPHIFVGVVTTFAGGTSVQAQLVQSANADLSSHDVLTQTDAIAVASLVAGYQFRLGTVPPGVTKRYLGIRYVVVGTPTAGAVDAALSVYPNA